jgi:hypothetical protein
MYNITNNYYSAILFLALIFLIISKYNTSILISIIIIIIFYYYIDSNIKKDNLEKKNIEDIVVENIDKGIDTIKELNTNNFYININNGRIKFLKKNKEFLDIINNLKFVKKFDKTRYNNLIIYANKLMKIYVYMPIFNDTVNDILEILYSFIFVVPEKFKHIYGFNPGDEIDKSITDFRNKVEKMLIVLNNYGKIAKKKIYIDIYKYSPYEKNKELYLP